MDEFRYSVAMKSVIGTREEQQDCSFFKENDEHIVAVVCDGMGAPEGGKIASTLVVEKVKDLYEQKDLREPFPLFFTTAVDILDELVFRLNDKKEKKIYGGTTIVAVAIEKDSLYWLAVGDSRLYILRNDEMVQITRDHNYFFKIDQQYQEGEIDENQYLSVADKGQALISFIGMGGIQLIDINHKPFKLYPKDTILLTTDGLYKALSDDEISQCLQTENTKEAMEALFSKAKERAYKAQDNTTCIVIKYEEVKDETDKM